VTQADDVEQSRGSKQNRPTPTAVDTGSAPTTAADTTKPGILGRWRILGWFRTTRVARLGHSYRKDLLVGLGFLALACTVLSGQWRDIDGSYLIKSGQDQAMWEWFFAVTANSLVHLENPLGNSLQNFPAGVNMMANTAMFGVGVPLAPITLLFGPMVTFVLVLTLGLAGTAFAWYRLFYRELVDTRGAAVVGGLFCGFAPAMISHANAHPNFVVLFLLPIIVGRMLAITRNPQQSRFRNATVLGLLVALQIVFGEEPLLIFALAFSVFGIAYYLREPRRGLQILRRAAPTIALGAAWTLLLTAVPLWWQFFGPQSYHSLDHGPMGNDIRSFTQFPSESLGGLAAPGHNVAINATEQNAYFGWPLLLLLATTVALLWRDRLVRAATAVIAVCAMLSIGPEAKTGEDSFVIPLPWAAFEQLPVVSSVLESRLTMAAVPAIAAILAVATDRAIHHWRAAAADWRPLAWFGALICALLPLVPTILPVTDRDTTPAFFTGDSVARYVDDGSVLVIPPPRPPDARALRWQYEADFTFPLAEGYFVGPSDEQKGMYGPQPRTTTALLAEVADDGEIPPLDSGDRDAAMADLQYWRADVVVLPRIGIENADMLRQTMSALLGTAPQPVDDVWLWDLREKK